MSGYDFLADVCVIEVAQLGPSSLGGYLADMGAQVIKVEGGPEGDPVRNSGSPAVGSSDGFGFLHLRWNRGKRSVGIDLKSDEGRQLFVRLAEQADIVIEGMRAGVLDRLGLGFDVLVERNPKLVYCSISGLGMTGPYHTLGSHGPYFDAFAGLASVNPYSLTADERAALQHTPVGMYAMGLHAAVGVLAALHRARATGRGALIEVAGSDSAAHWRADAVDVALNREHVVERPEFLNSRHKQAYWPRLAVYDTKDERRVFFQGLKDKFWHRFCSVVQREDLPTIYERTTDLAAADELIHEQLVGLFATRTLDDWMDVFLAHDIPGGPVNNFAELAEDPHFLARDNVYDVEYPGVGTLHLATTPVKTRDQTFTPSLAPSEAEHTDEVLSEMLGIDAAEIRRLRADGVVS